MKTLIPLMILALLAACGADGAPIAPSKAKEQGLVIGGEAQVGVSGGL
jgi:hypothetical protein